MRRDRGRAAAALRDALASGRLNPGDEVRVLVFPEGLDDRAVRLAACEAGVDPTTRTFVVTADEGRR